MYQCNECTNIFNEPKRNMINTTPMTEQETEIYAYFYTCPFCDSNNIKSINVEKEEKINEE